MLVICDVGEENDVPILGDIIHGGYNPKVAVVRILKRTVRVCTRTYHSYVLPIFWLDSIAKSNERLKSGILNLRI